MNEYFNFKDVAPDMSDIPSYASVGESVLYVMEANEINFNKLKTSIGLYELGVFESTGMVVDYVNEAEGGAKLTELKAKLIGFVTQAAAKIKGLFESILRKMDESATTALNAIEGKKALDAGTLKKAYAKVDPSKIKFKGGDYSKLIELCQGKGALNHDVDAFINSAVGSRDLEVAIKGIKSTLGGEITKAAVTKYLTGKVEDANGSSLKESDLEQIAEFVSGWKSNNKGLKSVYKNAEKSLNDLIKNIKSRKDCTDEDLKTCKEAVKVITCVYGTAMSCFYSVVRQDIMIAVKLVNSARIADAKAKAKEVTGKNESAVLDEACKGKDCKDKKDDKKDDKNIIDKAKDAVDGAVDAVKEKIPFGKEEDDKKKKKVKKEAATYTEEVESLFEWNF